MIAVLATLTVVGYALLIWNVLATFATIFLAAANRQVKWLNFYVGWATTALVWIAVVQLIPHV